ncbi:amino acid adenylation domain-containing protein [Amycolatopsis sp., V23-08]|uniref:Amino acid adenylation domain-containing protein n=1 Tax=Amycolatopsis heterodermiae TaxID=3110235 RepID=A0ABU5R5N2_9PSEU|nr:amino acid adenylation domain-containing protein [Amycolatopsis sp., V23-08]MEA5361542.1 amino acid adenylation domain-containing protein [Amycolatopsis sp., V23-08]
MTDTLPVAGTHGPPQSYPDTTVAGLILEQARRTPDALAVRQGGTRLTYAELAAAAWGVAALLRERGAGVETRVGVCAHRRPALVATVLGVLLSGGCYVPLEPGGPRARLTGIAADAGVTLVIGDAAVAEFGAVEGIEALDVPPPGSPGSCPATPDSTAHVLYTSGSTGRPKGVLTSHRNVVAFVTGFAGRLGVGPGTRTLGISSLGFDAFTMDVFVPLTCGGSVQLAGSADRADPERLRRFVVEHDVDWGFITPTLLAMLDPADVPGWRTVACGGEPVPAELAARWLPGRRFFHVYGPTETTVVVVTDEVTGVLADPLPLGTPTPNHRAHVVDADLRPVAPGEVGELLIGGPGVAAGYLGRPELTEQKFVADPFTPGERVYRTGDLARQLPDGRLEFAGRADRQVKVRGQRIELGEVEAALSTHPRVDAVAVEAVAGPAGTRLVAFLTPASVSPGVAVAGSSGAGAIADSVPTVAGSSGAHASAASEPSDGAVAGSGDAGVSAASVLTGGVVAGSSGARARAASVSPGVAVAGARPIAALALSGAAATALPSDEDIRANDRLTEAMRPAVIHWLDALPVNPVTGKIDRPALRALAERQTPDVLGEPETPVAQAVAQVWRKVLGAGAGPDFFASGGDSIAAMRLVAALRADLAADVATEDVLAGRTLDGVARRVAAAAPLTGPGLTTGHAPTLSPPQRRLWFLDQLAPDAAPYNIAMAFRLSGQLDKAQLRAALRAVAERHDILRWRIRPVDGVPQAECLPAQDIPLPITSLTEPFLDDRLAVDAATPVHLDREPPWRVRLYELGPDEHVLGFTLHHAVFDGWSQDLLCADLSAAYAGEPQPPLVASYADYAAWRADRDSRREAVDLAWWKEHLAEAPSTVDLPRDRPRPAVQTYHGASVHQVFPDGAPDAVRELAARTGTTQAGVLLAAFGQLLHRLTGGDDHLVATVVADRQLPETQDVAGFFVDIVPVRLRADDDADFATHARRGGAELLAATAHPAASIEQLVTALGVPRDPGRAPLVQVMVNVLNFSEPRLELPGVRAGWLPVAKPGSPFDLTVYVLGHGVELLYNPDLFDAARMTALAADYADLLAGLAAAPDVPVGTCLPETPRPAVRTAAPGAMTRAEPVPDPVVVDVAALAATEAVIAQAWREVLGVASVGVTDNFFDVGGHSLALMQVHAQVTARLGRRIPVVELFSHPTVRALAAHLHAASEARPDTALARAAERVAARRGRTPSRRPRRPAATNGHEQERHQ